MHNSKAILDKLILFFESKRLQDGLYNFVSSKFCLNIERDPSSMKNPSMSEKSKISTLNPYSLKTEYLVFDGIDLTLFKLMKKEIFRKKNFDLNQKCIFKICYKPYYDTRINMSWMKFIILFWNVLVTVAFLYRFIPPNLSRNRFNWYSYISRSWTVRVGFERSRTVWDEKRNDDQKVSKRKKEI